MGLGRASHGAPWKRIRITKRCYVGSPATRDIAFATRLCTRFIMLEQGRVAFGGTDTSDILRGWA